MGRAVVAASSAPPGLGHGALKRSLQSSQWRLSLAVRIQKISLEGTESFPHLPLYLCKLPVEPIGVVPRHDIQLPNPHMVQPKNAFNIRFYARTKRSQQAQNRIGLQYFVVYCFTTFGNVKNFQRVRPKPLSSDLLEASTSLGLDFLISWCRHFRHNDIVGTTSITYKLGSRRVVERTI